MAAINIYVGNLSFQTGEDQLKELFESYGQVESATINVEFQTNFLTRIPRMSEWREFSKFHSHYIVL